MKDTSTEKLVNGIGQGVLFSILIILCIGTAGVLAYTTTHGFALIGSVYMLVLAAITRALAMRSNRRNPWMRSLKIKMASVIALLTITATFWSTVSEAVNVDSSWDLSAVLNMFFGTVSVLMVLAWAIAVSNTQKPQ